MDQVFEHKVCRENAFLNERGWTHFSGQKNRALYINNYFNHLDKAGGKEDSVTDETGRQWEGKDKHNAILKQNWENGKHFIFLIFHNPTVSISLNASLSCGAGKGFLTLIHPGSYPVLLPKPFVRGLKLHTKGGTQSDKEQKLRDSSFACYKPPLCCFISNKKMS